MHVLKPALAAASMALLVLGLALPVFHIEKLLFWQHDYSIARATAELFVDGQYLLGLAVGLFVMLLPLLRGLALCALWLPGLLRTSSGPWRKRLITLDKWAMADVFALALLVVGLKLGDLVDVEPRMGLYFFSGAMVTQIASSILLARESRSRADSERESDAAQAGT